MGGKLRLTETQKLQLALKMLRGFVNEKLWDHVVRECGLAPDTIRKPSE